MRYAIEPTDQIYVKSYRFSSFAQIMGKSLCSTYEQKLLKGRENSEMDALKTASKRAIRKMAETTSNFVRNEIVKKIKNHFKD